MCFPRLPSLIIVCVLQYINDPKSPHYFMALSSRASNPSGHPSHPPLRAFVPTLSVIQVAGDHLCSYCLRPKHAFPEGLKKCSACKRVAYCKQLVEIFSLYTFFSSFLYQAALCAKRMIGKYTTSTSAHNSKRSTSSTRNKLETDPCSSWSLSAHRWVMSRRVLLQRFTRDTGDAHSHSFNGEQTW